MTTMPAAGHRQVARPVVPPLRRAQLNRRAQLLAGVLLAGLLLNSALGWRWADPVVGLVVAGLAVREGREAWSCEACTCIPALDAPQDTACGCDDGGCAA